MKKMHLYFFLSCLSCLSLLQSPLAADDLPESSTDNHTVVNSRPMSAEKKEQVQKNRQEELDNSSEAQVEESQADESAPSHAAQKKVKPLFGSQKKSLLYSNYQPFSNHWLTSMTIDGNMVELEDGSHWKIASSYYSFWSWKIGDSLMITPNQNIWSEYNYYITNKYTGDYVAADLFLGPIAFGPYTHWIVGIDYVSGHVFLENGTAWTVCASDYYNFSDWAINDTIIIGSNNSWISNYNSILINVNMNDYVRSLQY